MAINIADRVKETSVTNGTGSVTLGGAATGYQSFAAIGNGNECYYTIVNVAVATEWEVGIGTYISAGTLLSRNTVLASSNTGALVSFSDGNKEVFVTYPGDKAVYFDGSGNVIPLGTISSAVWNGSTIGVVYGGTGATTLTGYVKGTGTSPLIASGTIPNTDISGLGTIATQDANAVAITGGDINSTPIGSTTPSTGAFTTLGATGTSTLAAVNSGALAVTGAITSTTDATLSGLTVGKGAGAISTNTALGSSALNENTTGYNNTAIGRTALTSNTTGSNNTASGLQALNSNTTGSSNTAIGTSALLSNTTGSGNTALNPRNSSNNFAPVFDPTTQDNRFCMGSTAVTNAYIQVAWTVVSDARDKINFAPVPHGLEFVKALQPTAYQFRTARDSEETNGGVRYGFKAQDVLALEGANPVIVDNEDEDKLRMVDTALIPVLVKALQELNAKFDAYVLTHP